MAYIYVITNKINGKQYVGKTSESIQERWKRHIWDKNKRVTEKRPLYDAMNKYGIENFEIKQLEECSIENSSEREIYWIEKLNSFKEGYNATYGGDGKVLYDYKLIAEKYLELQNQTKVANFFHCDSDTVLRALKNEKVKILTSKEVSINQNSKKVAMIDLKTGETIKVFDSVAQAALSLGNKNKNSHIIHVCKGQRKSAYGYKWSYV